MWLDGSLYCWWYDITSLFPYEVSTQWESISVYAQITVELQGSTGNERVLSCSSEVCHQIPWINNTDRNPILVNDQFEQWNVTAQRPSSRSLNRLKWIIRATRTQACVIASGHRECTSGRRQLNAMTGRWLRFIISVTAASEVRTQLMTTAVLMVSVSEHEVVRGRWRQLRWGKQSWTRRPGTSTPRWTCYHRQELRSYTRWNLSVDILSRDT